MKNKITCLISMVFVLCSARAELAEQFDARDFGWITEVKNQSRLGACWAFATTSLLETSSIRAGLGTQSNTDFSEWQMANYAHAQSINEYAPPYYSEDYVANWGGNVIDTIYYTQAQFSSAFITEATAPYPLEAITLKEDLSSLVPSTGTRSFGSAVVSKYACAGLSGVDTFSATDVSFVKNKVQEFGAVDFGMAWSFNAITQNVDKSFVYNNTTTSEDGGHQITIVGWDDSIDVGGGSKGAFLVKNSWDVDWGNDGYFYLGYNSYVGDFGGEVLSWLDVSDASHLTSVYSTLPLLDGADESYQSGYDFYSVSAATKIDLDHSGSDDDTLLSLGLMAGQGDTYRLSLYDGDGTHSINELGLMTLLYEEEQTFEDLGLQVFDLEEAVDVSNVDELWLVYENLEDEGNVFLYEYDENALTEDLSFTLGEDETWEGAIASNTLAGVNFYMVPEPSSLLLFSIIGAGFLAFRRAFCL